MSIIVKLIITNFIILIITNIYGLFVGNDKHYFTFKVVVAIEAIALITLILVGVWGNYFV